MKRLFTILIVFTSTASFISAEGSLTHDLGSIQMTFTDWGAFFEIEDDRIFPNFIYKDKAYLNPFSEIWVGDSKGNVASAFDEFQGELVLGEWQPTASGSISFLRNTPKGIQAIYAQYSANRIGEFPYSITVDQYSYVWDSSKYKNSDFVLLKLILTNQGQEEIEDIFIGVETNWDIDILDWQDDSVDWEPDLNASIAYDPDRSDPNYTALFLISGKLRSHNIIEAPNWSFKGADRSSLISNAEFDDDIDVPMDYMSVISAGPYNIPSKGTVMVLYGFAVGMGMEDLKGKVQMCVKRSLTPIDLVAKPEANSVSLGWREPINPDVSTYRVYRRVDKEFKLIAELPAKQLSYVDMDTIPGTIYYYVVTAVNNSGIESERTDEVSALPGIMPSAPGNLVVEIKPFDKPVLKWMPSSSENVIGYKVFRNSTGTEPWTAIATLDKDKLTYKDEDTYDGERYFYTVAAISADGILSGYSNVVSVLVKLSTFVQPNDDLRKVKVVPNPCRDHFIKFVNLTSTAKIWIYDALGNLVKIIYHINGSGEERWDLVNESGAPIADGIYIFYVESLKPEETKKIKAMGKFAVIRK